jgi:hypothetical protein
MTTTQMTPEARRRLANQAEMWKARYAACATYVDVVRVAFDRARAVARTAERRGNPEVWKHLAELITNWCNDMEQAQAQTRRR